MSSCRPIPPHPSTHLLFDVGQRLDGQVCKGRQHLAESMGLSPGPPSLLIPGWRACTPPKSWSHLPASPSPCSRRRPLLPQAHHSPQLTPARLAARPPIPSPWFPPQAPSRHVGLTRGPQPLPSNRGCRVKGTPSIAGEKKKVGRQGLGDLSPAHKLSVAAPGAPACGTWMGLPALPLGKAHPLLRAGGHLSPSPTPLLTGDAVQAGGLVDGVVPAQGGRARAQPRQGALRALAGGVEVGGQVTPVKRSPLPSGHAPSQPPRTHLGWLGVSSDRPCRSRLRPRGLGTGLGTLTFRHQIAKPPISLQRE